MLNVQNLTNTLSRMELPDLQKYAAMHKNDPYVVSLALSIANQKKQMMVGKAGQAGMPPRPKVVDQQIAQMVAPPPQQMAAAPQQQMLPEDVGIGQLPAQNMQNMAEGGIVAFEDGGDVPGYKEGGKPLSTYIDMYAKKYNVNPTVLSRIIQAESEGKTFAKNPKSSAHGAGQLIDDMWEKMGGGDRKDAETQVRNAAKLLRNNTDNFKNATGREPSASEAYVTWILGDSTGRAVLAADPKASVEDVITKADPKNAAKIIESNASIFKNKNVADVIKWSTTRIALSPAVPVSTAQAAPAPAPAQAPAPAAPAQAAPAQAASAPAPASKFDQQIKDLKNFFFGDTSAQAPPPKDASQDQAALTSDPMTGFTMPQDTFGPSSEQESKYAAAQARAKAREALIDQIPGQTSKAPPVKPVDNSFLSLGQFESGAESLGLSKNVGRNVFNTLMAPTPLAPVTTLPKSGLGIADLGNKFYNRIFPAAGMSQKEIAALRAQTEAAKAADDIAQAAKAAEQAAKAPDIAQAAKAAPRIDTPPPAKAIDAVNDAIPVTKASDAVNDAIPVTKASDAVNDAIPVTKASDAVSDAIPVTKASDAVVQSAATQKAAQAAKATDNIPSAAERLQQAYFIRESDEAARLMAQAKAATNAKTAAQTATMAANAPEGIAALDDGMNYGYDQAPAPAPVPELLKKDEKDIIDALRKQTGATTGELKQQAADNGMDFNSFLIRFGLGLLAGESQYAAVNVGKAGLSALDAQLAEQKSRQAQALNLSDIEYRKAASRKATAEADYLERFGKDKNLALEAEKLIAQKLKDLPAFVQAEVAADPTRLAAIEKKFRQEIYLQLGINPIMAAGAPTGGAKFLGFENPA
jgi:hypothetical protein